VDLLVLGLSDLAHVEDALTIRSILGAVALAKGALKLGAWISLADESEINEMLDDRAAWSELYRQDLR